MGNISEIIFRGKYASEKPVIRVVTERNILFKYSISNIVNISLYNIKAETMLHALEDKDIYISTKTACSTNDISDSVYAITRDIDKSKSSLRISISYLTKKEDIDKFISVFSDSLNNLSKLNKNM